MSGTRPRDAFGRPLRPGSAGVAPEPDVPGRDPAATLARAVELLAAGKAFAAHEVLEAGWKAARAARGERPGPEAGDPAWRAAAPPAGWQGAAQVAVGLTHAQRGNPAGAARLLRRGAAGLADCDPATAAWARAAADAVEAGAAPPPVPDWPRLSPALATGAPG
ncbi:MAG TPA: DUF309 domain-containing protein [Frankiaceae bacterium]